MSDKLTAYRGEMFSSQQDGEVPQQNYGIDPTTGLPYPAGYAPQGTPQGGHGYAADGQVADQSYYQQDPYQGQQAGQTQNGGFTQQNPSYGYQEGAADPYNQQQYAQTDFTQTDHTQGQYGQAAQEQPVYGTAQQTYQPAQGQMVQGQAVQGQLTQGQYGQVDQNAYAQQNQGYVEEVDPYMAAHQNATLPYDTSNDALNQSANTYGYGQEQQGYTQQYQDPNAVYNEYSQEQQGYTQQYQDPNAAYAEQQQDGYYQQGAVAGLPAPDAYGTAQQQQYHDPNATDYNTQGLQPLQNSQQNGMIANNGAYGHGVDPAAMNASQADAGYDSDLQSSGRKSFLVGTMILGSVIIGGGVAFAYKYSGDSSGNNAPVITSEDTGIKAKPDNPGGREFANQNKKIFARLGDPGARTEAGIVASREPEVVESLRGEVKDVASASADPNGGPRRVRTYRIDRNGNQIIDNGAARAKLAGNDVKDMTGVTVDTGKPARAVRTLKANGAKKVQEKSIQIARAQAKAPAVSRVAASDGNYVVQISARRTQTDALAAFSGLQSKYGGVLGGYRPLIQRADLGSRGIWFRLRVGPMKSREDAASVCSQLKSKGMKNCLVASR